MSDSGRLSGGVVALLKGISSALLPEAPNTSGTWLASLGPGTTTPPDLCSLNIKRIAIIILVNGPRTHRKAGKL